MLIRKFLISVTSCCQIAGMKTTVRWLIGLKTDLKAAAKTYKMLIAFVQTGGGFINAKIPFR